MQENDQTVEKKSGTARCGIIALAGGAALLVIVLIAATIGINLFKPAPQPQAQFDLKPILVSISQPLNGATFAVNQTINIFVETYTEQPMQDIQLYVNGKVLPNTNSPFPPGKKKLIASWVLTPSKEGTISLLARASTQDGKTTVSNAVHIKVLSQDLFNSRYAASNIGSAPTPDPTQQAAFLDSIDNATESSPPPGYSEGGSEASPPEEEEPPAEEPPQEPPQQPGSNILPIGTIISIQKYIQLVFPILPPAAPTIDGGGNQCDGILIVQDNADNEAGFYLYRLDPGAIAFKQIATLDGKVGKAAFSYHDTGLANGDYMYYLVAFNAAGESASNIIFIHIDDPQCAAAVPPNFEPESIPIDASQPVDKAYCYGSADDMPWVRLPNAQDTFILPVNGKFDLLPYWDLIPLPKPLPPKFNLNMECWGWSGDTLVFLGSSTRSMDANKPEPMPGEPSPTPVPTLPGPAPTQSNPDYAAPYNLHITSDPSECASHTEKSQSYSGYPECMDWIGAQKPLSDPEAHHAILVWDWNQYGQCKPPNQACGSKPIVGFSTYRIRKGTLTVSYIMSPYIKYQKLTNPEPYNEYFVRAFGNESKESGDSNHIKFGGAQMFSLDPSAVYDYLHVMRYHKGNGWVQTPAYEDKWYLQPLTHKTMTGGYEFWENAVKREDIWYNSYAVFTLPEGVYIDSAKIRWVWASQFSKNDGVKEMNMACNAFLTFDYNGASAINSPIWNDDTQYDVSGMVKKAVQDGEKEVRFWFTRPAATPKDPRPDVCRIQMGNIQLILEYYSVFSPW